MEGTEAPASVTAESADSTCASRTAEVQYEAKRAVDPPSKESKCGDSTPLHRDERGALSVPFMLVFAMVVVGAVGVFGLQMRWRSLVTRQLRLDQCVEETALKIKDLANAIQVMNARIHEARLVVAATMVTAPEAVEAAKLVVEGLVTGQEALRAKWKLEQGAWIAKRGCNGEAGFIPLPLPSDGYAPRKWPDAWGPQPLDWSPGQTPEFAIRLVSLPRGSAARVHAPDLDSWKAHIGKGSWRAEWSPWASLR